MGSRYKDRVIEKSSPLDGIIGKAIVRICTRTREMAVPE
jgi:hypothetical protein